jgi:tetratricopeptide (TPR) repeat protein
MSNLRTELKILRLAAAFLALPLAARADTVRAAVGKPLQQASALIQEKNYQAALLKVHCAAAVPHLSPYETLLIAEVGGAAATGAGDYRQAAADYQLVLVSGSLAPGQQVQLIQAIAGFYYQLGDYPSTINWVNRYIAAQGQDPRTRVLLAQAYYQSGDYRHAEQAAARDVQAAQITGQAVPQAELQIFASSAQKAGDKPGYQTALLALLAAYPSPQYWAAAIDGLVASPEFPDRLTLDVYRLRRATGTLTAPGEYEDYAERAVLAGRRQEARAVINQGFSAQILTAQTDEGHAERLRTLLATSQPDSGAPQTPLDAAIAAFDSGDTAAAVTAFNQIAGPPDAPPASPDAALARLWAIRAARPLSR